MSSFIDKAKEKAQQGLTAGKQKAATVQAEHAMGKLVKELGQAYWNEQRHGGSHEEVVRALTRLDEFVARNGEPGTTGPGPHPTNGTGPAGGGTF